MNGLCNPFFTRTAFAHDQNRCFIGCNDGYFIKYRFEQLTFTNNAIEILMSTNRRNRH